MNDATSQAPSTSTFTLSIQLDAAKAGWLSNNAAPAIDFDLGSRFETPDSPVFIPSEQTPWAGDGTLMWCDNALEAIVLAACEEHSGYATLLLWDLAASEINGFGGHVVLTARPYGSW